MGHLLELKVMDEFLIQFESRLFSEIQSWHWVRGIVGLGPCWDVVSDIASIVQGSRLRVKFAYVVAEEMD